MGLSDILAMLMQHGGSSMFPGGGGSSGFGSMLPGTNLPTPQPLASMNTPNMGQMVGAMPAMDTKPSPFATLGSALGSSSGESGSGLRLTDANYGLSSQSNGLHALLQQILGQ